jgi:hypothetical protein
MYQFSQGNFKSEKAKWNDSGSQAFSGLKVPISTQYHYRLSSQISPPTAGIECCILIAFRHIMPCVGQHLIVI